MTNNLPATVSDIERMAVAVSNSKLFGMSTKDEAMALMLIAHAEGLHPAIAATHYHIINGRPSLKADAMLSRFQNAGGSVKWVSLSDEKAEAEFSHPQGGTVTISWDMERKKLAQIKNPMWDKYPRQMLRARVISEGIRTVYPGVSVGLYVEEEVRDFEPEKPAKRERVASPKDAIDVESTPVAKPLPQAVAEDEIPDFAAKLADNDPVLVKAREEAHKGVVAFREFWLQNKHIHKDLKPHIDELKQIAEMMDEQKKDAA